MSIYSKKQAYLLGQKNTIDLKYIIAKEYVDKIEGKDTKFYFYYDYMKKAIVFIALIWFIIVSLYGWKVFVPETHANSSKSKITYENLLKNSSVEPPFKIYSRLKDECFAQKVRNKEHCIKVGLSIAYAESSWKDYQTPFGLQSKEKGYKKWVSSYKKYLYKAKDGFFFYGDFGKLGRSHYCTSEESSGSKRGCPNGRKNFDKTFSAISFGQ